MQAYGNRCSYRPIFVVTFIPSPRSSTSVKFSAVLAFESSKVLFVTAVPEVVVFKLFMPICINPVRLASAKMTPKDNKEATATRVF